MNMLERLLETTDIDAVDVGRPRWVADRSTLFEELSGHYLGAQKGIGCETPEF